MDLSTEHIVKAALISAASQGDSTAASRLLELEGVEIHPLCYQRALDAALDGEKVWGEICRIEPDSIHESLLNHFKAIYKLLQERIDLVKAAGPQSSVSSNR